MDSKLAKRKQTLTSSLYSSLLFTARYYAEHGYESAMYWAVSSSDALMCSFYSASA